jgi:hypothetical protein
MGSGKIAYWSIGKIPLDREAIKCMSSLFKPTFHYSIIPSGLHETCSIKNVAISIRGRNSDTFSTMPMGGSVSG